MHAMKMSINLVEVYNTILHQGITTYKTKQSKASLPERVRAEKEDKRSRKGSIFAVRSKDDFTSTGVKGYVITSKETLLEDAEQLTHFTPNVFRVAYYADNERRKIKGFVEENLQQINTFVVDIDTKRFSVQDILLACIDESIGAPTLIIESDRGYQVHFVLAEPLFISNKNEFRSLVVAKRISDNLKRSLQCVEADIYCNDFGFFRLPKANNIVWAHLENTYTVAELIEWSRRQDDNRERPLFVVPQKMQIASVLNSDWFYALIQAVEVKGKKGQIGRNNALFTLALICMSEGWEKERTFDFLDEYNARLHYPLTEADLNSVMNSAYSGRYKGASKEYIEGLLALYVKNGETIQVNYGARGWYKHKKERKDRVRSHYDEWEQDIIDYITAQKSEFEPFIWHTQKELCEAVGIPQSTLNVVLKQSTKLLKTKKGKGRGAKTGWTTVNLLLQYALKQVELLKARKSAYRIDLKVFVEEWIPELEAIAGYKQFISYVQTLNSPNSMGTTLPKALGNSS